MTNRVRSRVGAAAWCLIAAALVSGCAGRRPATFTPQAAAALQQEIVSKLSGASDIRPGVRVAGRSSANDKKEARDYLAVLIERFGLNPERQAYSADGENVFAVLSCGRPSAPLVVLGAHYDTVRTTPGANDDATGVAAVMAVAAELSQSGAARTRDIAFVFFDEEERGLRGSRAFAEMLRDRHRAVDSVHTIDQVGWDQNGNRAIELELPYDGAVDAYGSAARALGLNVPILVTTEAGSDHSAFRRLGFRAVGVTEEYRHGDTTPYIHKPGDTAATVNLDYLASTTRVLAKVIDRLSHAAP